MALSAMALAAASAIEGWSAELHPRGKDGRFIEKEGCATGTFNDENGASVKVSNAQISGFKKAEGDDAFVLVEQNGRFLVAKASEINRGTCAKARLDAEAAGIRPDVPPIIAEYAQKVLSGEMTFDDVRELIAKETGVDVPSGKGRGVDEATIRQGPGAVVERIRQIFANRGAMIGEGPFGTVGQGNDQMRALEGPTRSDATTLSGLRRDPETHQRLHAERQEWPEIGSYASRQAILSRIIAEHGEGAVQQFEDGSAIALIDGHLWSFPGDDDFNAAGSRIRPDDERYARRASAFEDTEVPTLQLTDGIYDAEVEWVGMIREDVSALTAATFPVNPPHEWFDDPKLKDLTPLTIENGGRVYGHIAAWHTSHIGLAGGVKPPRSKSNYSFFRTGVVECDDGSFVNVGQITLAGGHAPLETTVARAVAHYDDTNSAVMDVASGEDRHGIWVAGALRPTVTPEQIRTLRASSVSGDWRPINGRLELVAICAVNCPGFPIPRARVAAGAPIALVAAGVEPLVAMAMADRVQLDVEDRVQQGMMIFRERISTLEQAVLAMGLQIDDPVEPLPEPETDYTELRRRARQDIDATVASLRGRVREPVVASLREKVREPMVAALRQRVHTT